MPSLKIFRRGEIALALISLAAFAIASCKAPARLFQIRFIKSG